MDLRDRHVVVLDEICAQELTVTAKSILILSDIKVASDCNLTSTNGDVFLIGSTIEIVGKGKGNILIKSEKDITEAAINTESQKQAKLLLLQSVNEKKYMPFVKGLMQLRVGMKLPDATPGTMVSVGSGECIEYFGLAK